MPQNNLLQENFETPDSAVTPSTSTRLEKQKLDFRSVRMQMILGLTAALVVCIVAYLPSLKVGFLLDDFLHVDYVARAFAGDSRDFLANFTSNWAGSDLMKSYRPLVSMTFWTDYALWHANAYGYHLTNVLLLAGCCLFVALIALELTGRTGNRMMAAPALWAALLFAVYPLHPEAAAWIVGRVDLICTLFYLVSVFCFLRFQQIRESQYLLYSLIAFVLAAVSKEMAVTLPVVVTGAAILLRPSEPARPGEERKRYTLVMTVKHVWIYWAALALIAVIRMELLGTLIGGYGQSDSYSALASLRSFADRESLLKIFVPVSEEMHIGKNLLRLCGGLITAALTLGIIKNIICRSSWKPTIFLIFWCALALLPTFQIWHIYPNLVGSRLFFLSSAPLCILLALLAQPATEIVERRTSTILAVIGAAILSGLFLAWLYCLELNLAPWTEAGRRMAAIQIQLDQLVSQVNGQVALMTLPTDYKGAGMITRPVYLQFLSRPPFHKFDLSHNLLAVEANAPDHELAQRLRTLSLAKSCYIWEENEGKFVPWRPSTGVTHLSFEFAAKDKNAFDILPPQVVRGTENAWKVRTGDEPYVEQHADFIRVFPSTDSTPDHLIRLTPKFMAKLNPLQAEDVVVKCSIHEKEGLGLTDQPNKPPRLSICWQADSDRSGESPVYERPLQYLSTDLYICPVGENLDWCRLRDIGSLGIKCSAGNYVADIYWLKAGNSPGAKTSIGSRHGKIF